MEPESTTGPIGDIGSRDTTKTTRGMALEGTTTVRRSTMSGAGSGAN